MSRRGTEALAPSLDGRQPNCGPIIFFPLCVPAFLRGGPRLSLRAVPLRARRRARSRPSLVGRRLVRSLPFLGPSRTVLAPLKLLTTAPGPLETFGPSPRRTPLHAPVLLYLYVRI